MAISVRRAALLLIATLACHAHPPQAPSPAAPTHVVVVGDGLGLFVLDARSQHLQRVSGGERFRATMSERVGAYLVSDDTAVDLRDLAILRTPFVASDSEISSEPGVTTALTYRSETHALVAVNLATGAEQSVTVPVDAVDALAISPDARHVALVARRADGTEELQVGVTGAVPAVLTTDVRDAVFVDNATLLYTRSSTPAFAFYDLRTQQTQDVRAPDAWAPADLDDYTTIRPWLPLVSADASARAVLDPATRGLVRLNGDEQIVAVSPDRKNIIITDQCQTRLVARSLDGARNDLLGTSPGTCGDGHVPPTAAFFDDAEVVFAVRPAARWVARLRTPRGTKDLVAADGPLRVAAMPAP